MAPDLSPNPTAANSSASVRARAGGLIGRAERGEGPALGMDTQRGEHGHQGERADMRQRDVDESRAAHLHLFMLEHDQQVATDRHDLPRRQEGHHGLGGHHADQRHEQQGEERVRAAATRRWPLGR